MCSVGYTGAAALAVMGGGALDGANSLQASTNANSNQQLSALHTLPDSLKTVQVPQLEEPQWLVDQKAAERAAAEAARKQPRPLPGQKITVTYDVATRGTVTASLAEFKQLANATLNDTRGWSRLGVFFQEVASGGQFTLVLSEASQLPSFSEGCSAEYSCNVGRFVIINQDRWLGATSSWNAASGSLRDYQHMVVNHETGHWLGHGHSNCGGPGQPAAVMQQQSINLQGCTFNPWPLEGELRSSRLGL